MKKFILLLLLMPIMCFSQEVTDTTKNKKIEIIHSNTLNVTPATGPDLKILVGEVEFYHDSATMFCDSAHFNTKLNQFTAFNNIHILKPSTTDTLELFGDTLFYDGQNKLAKVRDKVVVIKDSMTLYTNYLDFDLINDIGYYSYGGKTINGKDTLVSEFGYYYSKDDELFFKNKVKITNPDYTISADTLKHNLKTKVSNFFGSTEIVSDSNFIYCENGWYDHQNDVSQFNENAYFTADEHNIKGDSLFYDRKNGLGKAYNNVVIRDTVQNVLLFGNHGEFYEKTEQSMMTDKAYFIQITDADSLFIHADTLRARVDTLTIDSLKTPYRLIRAYNHVKLFKTDIQAKCDSAVYTMKDSTIEMYQHPVLWSNENQLTSNFIKIDIVDNQVETIFLEDSAFICSKADSINFDQIKGEDMYGYVQNGELFKVKIIGNTHTIYFIKDQDYLMGINKITSDSMTIFLKESKIDKIWFYSSPKGKMHPPFTLSVKELFLDGFFWYEAYRPRTREEIFIWKREE